MTRHPAAVNARAAADVRLHFAQNFARQGSGLSFSQEKIFEDIKHGVAFSPSQIKVRHGMKLVADVEHESSKRVGNRRAFAA